MLCAKRQTFMSHRQTQFIHVSADRMEQQLVFVKQIYFMFFGCVSDIVDNYVATSIALTSPKLLWLKVFSKIVVARLCRLFEFAALMNASSKRLTLFVKAMKTDDNMKQLFTAMKDAGETDLPATFDDDGKYFTWQQFCHRNNIDGNRLRELLEPLMDLGIPILLPNGAFMPLRDFGNDWEHGYLLKIDMLVGGSEKPPQYWVMCAMYLAKTPEFPVPSCMQNNFLD